MKQFKVGDKVEVVEPGNTYTTYKSMFAKMKFRNPEKNEFFQKGLIATVFAVCEHETDDVILLGLEALDGSQCLMSTKGVVKIVSRPSSDDQFDIIREFCDEVLDSQNISDADIYKYLLSKCC
jgi:hypothetical protein